MGKAITISLLNYFLGVMLYTIVVCTAVAATVSISIAAVELGDVLSSSLEVARPPPDPAPFIYGVPGYQEPEEHQDRNPPLLLSIIRRSS